MAPLLHPAVPAEDAPASPHVDPSPAAWLVDRDATTLLVTDALAELLGYEGAGALTGTGFFAHVESGSMAGMLAPGDLPGAARAVRFRHKDGGTVFARAIFAAVVREDGETCGTLITVLPGQEASGAATDPGPPSFIRTRIQDALRSAVRDAQLTLHYRPVLQLETTQVSGLETLLHVPTPDLKHVPVRTIIAAAESGGLIKNIGQWWLFEATRQFGEWRRSRLVPDDAWIAVNVSPAQVTSALPDLVGEALSFAGLAPHQLCLEITETTDFADETTARAVLDRVREAGVHLAVDNFGIGWSSVFRAARLPIDILKIDRAFLAQIDSRRQDVLAAMVLLADALGATPIGEGVENVAAVEALRNAGCRFASGVLWTPALPPGDATLWLLERLSAPTRLRTPHAAVA